MIIHVRVPSKRKKQSSKNAKSASASGASTSMRIERNSEGVFYFRQSQGPDRVVTWHIYPSGEKLLRERNIEEGQCLPRGMFTQLRESGALYTEGRSTQSRVTVTSHTTVQKSPQTQMNRDSGNTVMRKDLGQRQAQHNAQRPQAEGRRTPVAKSSSSATASGHESARQSTPGNVQRGAPKEQPNTKQSDSSRQSKTGKDNSGLASWANPNLSKMKKHPVQRTAVPVKSALYGATPSKKHQTKPRSAAQPNPPPDGSSIHKSSSPNGIHPGWLSPRNRVNDASTSKPERSDEQ